MLPLTPEEVKFFIDSKKDFGSNHFTVIYEGQDGSQKKAVGKVTKVTSSNFNLGGTLISLNRVLSIE